jgi:hypothetical protein
VNCGGTFAPRQRLLHIIDRSRLALEKASAALISRDVQEALVCHQNLSALPIGTNHACHNMGLPELCMPSERY